MSWHADQWSALGQIVGAAGTVAAAGIAAYTATKAKSAAETSADTARQAARALALHEMPRAYGMVVVNADGELGVQFSVGETVSGTVILRRGGMVVRRLEFSGRNVDWTEAAGADEVEIEFIDQAHRRWRWRFPIEPQGLEVESHPLTSATYQPLDLVDP